MAKYSILSLLSLLFLVGIVSAARSGKKPHHFEFEDQVPFFVNKIGPYLNPTEAYEFYDLPFCRPGNVEHKHSSMGEALSGTHKVSSLYDIRFQVPIHFSSLCGVKHLTVPDVNEFIAGIDKFFYFEMIIDDLPVRGFIGTVEKEVRNGEQVKHYYLFKHLHFTILWNEDNVIYANVSADPHKLQELVPDLDADVEFSYSASWEQTDVKFADRNKLYVDAQELEIHWLSILNSCVLVLLLTGFLAIIIMRILKSDLSRYARAEDEEDDQEDYGWKLIHGDVFRFPAHKNLFSALLGLGAQSLSIVFSVLVLAMLGFFYPNNRGSMFVASIVLYCLTCCIGGYVSAYFFKQMGGEKWVWNIMLVATLYTGPLFIVFVISNTLAIAYGVTAAVPFGTIMMVFLLLVGVGFPLNVLGGIAGKRGAGPFEAPVRTKNFPREIPSIPWYRSLPVQMIMSGFLPFSAIYIELFYVFSSIWGRNTYQLFGILFIVAVILIIVTACITVALTYFQLSMEDHRWWWHSFLSGGSTGIFIFGYSFFYYVYRSRMSGVIQGWFYFLYMFLACYFFFIMLGAVGWYSSLVFVRKIYQNLKCD